MNRYKTITISLIAGTSCRNRYSTQQGEAHGLSHLCASLPHAQFVPRLASLPDIHSIAWGTCCRNYCKAVDRLVTTSQTGGGPGIRDPLQRQSPKHAIDSVSALTTCQLTIWSKRQSGRGSMTHFRGMDKYVYQVIDILSSWEPSLRVAFFSVSRGEALFISLPASLLQRPSCLGVAY